MTISETRERGEQQREDALAAERTARAAAEAAEERLAFLARASALLATSLDYEATVEAVAGLAIPYLADWCSVDVVDPDGSVRRMAVTHADPAKAAIARRIAHYPPDPAGLHPRTQVLRTGRSYLAPDVTEAGLATVTRDAEQLRVMQSLGYRSAMIVALVARGQTLGALTFATAESERHYGPADVALAEQLASRAALALDNARLFRDAQQALAARYRSLVEEQAARREAEQARAEAERAQRDAESANTAKDDFLAILSHELRSPLGVILTWSHLLRRGALDAARVDHAIDRIERSALAQKQMIEDLLDVSRVIAGKLRLDVQPTDLTDDIEAAVDAFRAAAHAKGVELRSVPPPLAREPWVQGDPVRLQQIVSNLLNNALKFTPASGRVEVRVEPLESEVRIIVRDTGQGIAADFLPRVFEPFRQADSSSTRTHGGLGLGLAIVRHLVELHGGRVAATSAGAGQGATFTVTLPLLVQPRDHRRDVPGISGGSTLQGIHVLLVDDEEDARQVIATALELSGAAVTAVASAREALQAVERVPADVLVSDIAMPDMDGYDLLHQLRLRRESRGSRLPAVALTAYAGREHRLRALDAGYAIHLSKPVGIPELLTAIAQLAGQGAKIGG